MSDPEYLEIPAFLRRRDSKEYKDWAKTVRENIEKENEFFKEMDEIRAEVNDE